MDGKQLVINKTDFSQEVRIVSKTDAKQKTVIYIMAKRRAFVPSGYKVDGNWMALNPNAVRVVEPNELIEWNARNGKVAAPIVTGNEAPPASENDSNEGAE